MVQKDNMEKLDKSFPVNILGNLLSPAEAVLIFPFQGMSRTSVSPVLVKSGILSCLRGYLINHAALMAANALVGS